jgi:hypothetical protein
MKYAVYLDSGIEMEVDYDAEKEENHDRFRQDAAKKLLKFLKEEGDQVDVHWEVY